MMVGPSGKVGRPAIVPKLSLGAGMVGELG